MPPGELTFGCQRIKAKDFIVFVLADQISPLANIESYHQPLFQKFSFGVVQRTAGKIQAFEPIRESLKRISTVIQGQEKPYGILGAHSATSRVFTQDDAQFVNSIANVLAQAIQRYESREKLKISEDQYADLYEHAPVMYVCVEVKTGLIRQCNNTVVDQLGYKKGEILGRRDDHGAVAIGYELRD